ncbi:MAG: PVC-type heme-binding CxxCH protein [Planctomycetaceae bacterium]
MRPPRDLSVIRPALVAVGLLFLAAARQAAAAEALEPPIRVLFLGDRGHHAPADRFAQLAPVLADRGIKLVWTEDVGDVNPSNLARYDALAVYANIDELPAAAEEALVGFVRGGKGLVPLHCASFCFRNSAVWVEMVGAQFQRHDAGEFRTTILVPDHPVMEGFQGFSSFDETYVHTRHNPRGRTVLEERVEGEHHEPWTWVRSEGKGRVFYTAWGQDVRTWFHPGFHALLERGIRWAAGRDPAAAGPYVDHPAITRLPDDLEPFAYVPARVPAYDPTGKKWGEQLEPASEMQAPLSPEESLKHARVPEGFHAEIVAAEPVIAAKPLCMAFDASGRLFVAESLDYPNELVLPADGPGHDRIVRLDDTDGDGVADARHVVAEGLSIPTSILPHDGGWIVAAAPQILLLDDRDGDGVTDERRVLSSGWGTGDTHSGPSNLTWGLDGWVYGMVGYSGFDGDVGGERVRFGAGFFRFLPDGSRLEFLRSTNNNSWGFGFSEEGLVFGSTANGNPSEHMPLANRVYERVRGWSATTLGGIAGTPKMELAPRADGSPAPIRQVDHFGRFTAAAGHRLYTARDYPREYWNRAAFVCEPTGHVVATFQLTPRGAGFSSRMAWNLLASDDEWSAPIAAEVGPDGQVWVIDWYNYIVQHNPTPAGFENGRGNAYETPLRDKTHGRIQRVVHGEAAAWAFRDLAVADAAGLVAMLADPNLFWRSRAQRTLVERIARLDPAAKAAALVDVTPRLVALVKGRAVDAIGLDPGAIHALWTLHNLGLLGESADVVVLDAARKALSHPSAGVRMNALKVLPRDEATLVACDRAAIDADASPLVRLVLAEALSEFPAADLAGGLVLRLLRDPRTLADPILADAATAAAAVQAGHVLPALLEADRAAGLGAAALLTGLVAAEDPPAPRLLEIVGRVAEHVARGGDVGALARTLVAAARADGATAAATVEGLARGWPRGRAAALPPEAEAAVVALVERLPAAAQGQLVSLVQHTGSRALDDHVERIGTALLAELDRTEAPDEARVDAARRLVSLRGADAGVVGALLERVGGRNGPEVSAGLVAAVAGATAPGAETALLDRLPSMTPAVRDAALRAVLGNKEWAAALVDRLEEGTLAVADIPLVERGRLAEHPDRTVRERARKVIASGGGLPAADRQEVIDAILPVVRAGGDAARGKGLFKEQCGKCHTHSGEGGKVGPELTGMAVHPPHELLIHILDPNRSVEGNYRSWTVTTDDGRVVTGLLAAESRTAVEIVDAEGKRHAIQRDEIDEFQPSPNSLMPVGFEKQIKPEGFADLLAFLTAKGKYVPVPLDKAATVVTTKGMFFDPQGEVERLVFPDWKPKMVGSVPFVLVDPQGDTIPNAVMLHGPQGLVAPRMPRAVSLPLGAPAAAIHLLSGVSGWGFPATTGESTSLVVRLVYADGGEEDHDLKNGRHFADYIRRVDVPESAFAFDLAGRQIRYLAIHPARKDVIERIELVKGDDPTAPVVMAVTAESP